MDKASVLLHRQEQLARHDVALRGSPDFPAHRFAGGELVERADQSNVDPWGVRRP
jgi:hypothetical protein